MRVHLDDGAVLSSWAQLCCCGPFGRRRAEAPRGMLVLRSPHALAIPTLSE